MADVPMITCLYGDESVYYVLYSKLFVRAKASINSDFGQRVITQKKY